MDKKTIVVVGSGIGGLSTAIRLLYRGFKVKIFEKENSIGGKVNIIKEKDFKFDLSASIVMMPKEYSDLFMSVGRDIRDYLEIGNLETLYKVFYEDGRSYEVKKNTEELNEMLKKNFPEDVEGYGNLINESYRKYKIAEKYFLNKSFYKKRDFFNLRTLSKAMEIKTLNDTYSYTSNYIKNEKLREYIAFQSMYVGMSPYREPNIYTLIPAVTQIDGLWYIKGGMYAYVEALEKLVHELGGEIYLNSNVEKIIIERNCTKGVIINGRVEKADIVVCNADFPYAIKSLVEDSFRGKYKNICKMKYSCSTFIIYLALNKKYRDLKVHNMFLSKDFKNSMEEPFKGILSNDPSMYIYCPTYVDESLCENGIELMNIMVRVPNLIYIDIQWSDESIKSYRNLVMSKLKTIKELENIEENIVYESYFTPEDFKRKFNSYGGTAFGLSHELLQTNYFRPSVKSDNVKNLYFVGSSVQPGNGISIVLKGSKLVEYEIIEDIRENAYI